MSQPGTPFNDTSSDPFIPSIAQGDYGNDQLTDGYCSSEQGPEFSPAGSNIFDLDSFLDDDSHLASTGTTNVSTPDFSGYNFGTSNHLLSPCEYPPPPDSAAPHPYPIQQQYYFNDNAQLSRPPIVRSAMNTPHLRPPQQHFSRTQQPYHRRSVSQSDADRVAATLALNQTPSFVRHLAPRSRPLPSNISQYNTKKSKLGPGVGSRGTSQEPGSRMMVNSPSNGPTSMPTPRMETSIGTPTHITLTESSTPIQTSSSGPIFRQMSYETQMAESPRILEIGAMAVINSPRWKEKIREGMKEGEDRHKMLLRKLDEMEGHLKIELGQVHYEEGIRGCEMIREALVKRKEDEQRQEQGDRQALLRTSTNTAPDAEFSNVTPNEIFSAIDTYTEQPNNTVVEEDDLFELLMSDPNANNFATEDI